MEICGALRLSTQALAWRLDLPPAITVIYRRPYHPLSPPRNRRFARPDRRQVSPPAFQIEPIGIDYRDTRAAMIEVALSQQ
jgi:hypothetical protein